jgi:ribosomal protein S18 acetylase RimI-like enzyme
MQILPLSNDDIPEAAALFNQNYREQCQITPGLSGAMLEATRTEQLLANMSNGARALAALDKGQVAGYISWFLVEQFRGTERKGAYVPEWGHCVRAGDKKAIYQELYRAAGECWSVAGCQVHAISILAHDQAAESAWYWNGFGLTVVDAIRAMQPLGQAFDCRLTIRKATMADAEALSNIDAEHWRHYSGSPIFMAPPVGKDASANVVFLEKPKNSVWLAEECNTAASSIAQDREIAGFMRFEGYDFDSVASLMGEDRVILTGAYVRPAHRGRRIAPALLDAALRDYQSRGLNYCVVTFESFNPEAASFWPRYFEPVCHSLLRVPEYVPARSNS